MPSLPKMLETYFSAARSGDQQSVGDALVGGPVAISSRTSRSRGVRAASGSSARRRDSRVDTIWDPPRNPPATRRTRGDELVDVADPVLEQVADAFGGVGEQPHRQAELDVLGEHQHARTGRRRMSRRPAAPRRCAWAAAGCRRRPRPGGSPRGVPGVRRRRRSAPRRRSRRRRAGGPAPRAAARCPPRWLPARQLRPHPGAAAGRAPDPQAAAERLHPVGQAAQARPRSVSAPPGPSSAISTTAGRRSGRRPRSRGRLGVPADVGQALAHHVVGGHLDRLGQPSAVDR